MKKRVISLLLCSAMVATMFAGCGGSDNGGAANAGGTEAAGGNAATDEGKKSDPATTINLYSFTDEVPKMVEKYIEEHPDFGYTVNTTIVSTTDGAYPPAH